MKATVFMHSVLAPDALADALRRSIDPEHFTLFTEAYNTFYTALSKVLVRHPEQMPQFFRMIHAFHYVDNVDEWPWLCGLASKVYDAAPRQYMSAVKRVEHEYRQESLDCRKPPDAP